MIAVLTDDDRELFLAGSVVDEKIEGPGHGHPVTGKQQHWDDGVGWELRDIFLFHIYISIGSEHSLHLTIGVLQQFYETWNVKNRLSVDFNFVFYHF